MMKKAMTVIAATSFLLATGGALADQEKAGHHHGEHQSRGMMMDMSQDMQHMRDTMHQMRQATSRETRMKLMNKHGEQMHAMLQRIQSAQGMRSDCAHHTSVMQQMMGHIQAQQRALEELQSRRRYGPPGKQR